MYNHAIIWSTRPQETQSDIAREVSKDWRAWE